jgi:hypothetical protein
MRQTTIDNLANALGVHQLLDAITERVDGQTLDTILKDIMLQNGLEVGDTHA